MNAIAVCSNTENRISKAKDRRKGRQTPFYSWVKKRCSNKKKFIIDVCNTSQQHPS
jgi:hypothetical protein